MAKGKKAAGAAIRRAEAAHEHIDRLTEQLMDAKSRARQYEAAAIELPAVRAELGRLRSQLAEATSDAVERERERRREDAVRHQGELAQLVVLLMDVMDRGDVHLGYEDWDFVSGVVNLAEVDPEVFGNSRTSRRNSAKRHLGTWAKRVDAARQRALERGDGHVVLAKLGPES